MTIKKTLDIPVYECKLHIFIAPNIDRVIKSTMKKLGLPYEDGRPVFGFALTRFTDYYLFLHSTNLTYNTVAHELRHIVDYILEDREFEVYSEKEAAAYLSGYLFEEVMHLIIKKNIEIK